MIDAHIHVVPPNLPGVGPLDPLLSGPPEALADALEREMRAAGIATVLAMGALSSAPTDPLGVDGTLRLARRIPGLRAIGVANPGLADADHINRCDAVLARHAPHEVCALKGYLGYLHYPPDHPGYGPYFELAARHNIPFVFHTGDTYSPKAKLRFAQPLQIDDVAVDHPRVRFVMAHLGNPWMQDAAEVVYKNINVWADLSGIVTGDAGAFAAEERLDLLNDARGGIRQAFRYAERPNRFVHGSDWPLAPLGAYRSFVASCIPADYHSLVFTENARLLFRL